jgi:hypothetical protein
MRIKIKTTDGQIWYKEQIILELVKSLSAVQKTQIDLHSEGPCATELGLYNLLDSICNFYQFDSTLITIETSNLIEHSDRYKIIRRPPFVGKGEKQLVDTCQSWSFKTITDQTKHFGSFVGRGNRMRLAVSGYLFYHQQNKTLLSYHTDVTNPYFNEFIGLEEMMFHKYNDQLITDSFKFLKVCPIKLDEIVQYPIHVERPATNNIIDYYPKIFLEIVYQPFCLGNTFFVDEKIWRAIGTRTPFIVQGPQYFLQNLKRMGFKTFDHWWDEGYSQDPADCQTSLIINTIKDIANWSTDKLANVYEEMKPILEHNHSVLMSLTHKDFLEIFNHV